MLPAPSETGSRRAARVAVRTEVGSPAAGPYQARAGLCDEPSPRVRQRDGCERGSSAMGRGGRDSGGCGGQG